MLLFLLSIAGALSAQQLAVKVDGLASSGRQSSIELGSFPVGVPTRVAFMLSNNSAESLVFNSNRSGVLDATLRKSVTISSQSNCSVTLSEQPAVNLLPGTRGQLFLDITAHEIAPLAFTVIVSDGFTTQSQQYTGSGAESSTVWLLGVSVSAKSKHDGHCSAGEESGLFMLGAAVLVSMAFLIRRRKLA
jgi:uncharacterized protein (TIGR03382 family)